MQLDDLLFNLLFDSTTDGVYIVDPHRQILAWNNASERITGYSREKMIGQFCQSNLLMHCDDNGKRLCKEGCPLSSVLLDGSPRETQVYLHHASGHRVPVSVRVLPIINHGQIRGAVEIFNENLNLAFARARIEALEKTSMLDPLTGIANRRTGQARLDLLHAEFVQSGVPFGVLMIDIDHFKQFNDRYGHPMGDRIIQIVAASLTSGLRSHDIIARWGGEEFLAIHPNASLTLLKVVAERLRMLVENSVFYPDHKDRGDNAGMRVTISLGGALALPGDSVAAVLERADQNLYISKSTGRNRATT